MELAYAWSRSCWYFSPKHAGRIPGHHRSGRHIFRHHAARAHDRSLPNRHAAQNRRPRPNRSSFFDRRRDTLPVSLSLQATPLLRRTRKTIVDERYAVANKHLVLERHAFAEKAVTRDLAAAANPRAFLNFNKSAHLRVVSDFTTVKIGKRENLDPLAKLHIRCNTSIRSEERRVGIDGR